MTRWWSTFPSFAHTGSVFAASFGFSAGHYCFGSIEQAGIACFVHWFLFLPCQPSEPVTAYRSRWKIWRTKRNRKNQNAHLESCVPNNPIHVFALMGAFFVHAAVAEVESGSTAIPAFIFNMIGGTLQNALLVGHGILMVFIILLASLLDYFIRLVLMPLVADFVKYTETKLDDIIFDDGVVKYLSQLLPVTLIYFLLPLSFDSGSVWLVWMQKLCKVCLVIVSCRMFIAMLSAGRKILEEVEKQGDLSGMKGRPMELCFSCSASSSFLSVSSWL